LSLTKTTIVLPGFLVIGCWKPKGGEIIPLRNSNSYYTAGSKLIKNGSVREFRGTDKMSLLDRNYDVVSSWGMDITRECIDMKCTSDEDLQALVSLARNKGFALLLKFILRNEL